MSMQLVEQQSYLCHTVKCTLAKNSSVTEIWVGFGVVTGLQNKVTTKT